MPSLLLDGMDAPWISSAPGLLAVAADALAAPGGGGGSNRLEAQSGAAGARAELVPAAPLDLDGFDELRFWVRGGPPADGSPTRPFYLELSFVDDGDLPGEEHRWLVPVERPGRWEQRRVGMEADRRGSVSRLRFTVVGPLPFACHLDGLRAVREEMLPDAEEALVSRLAGVTLPGLAAVPLDAPAAPGDTALVVAHTPGFHGGNAVRLEGGGATERFAVSGVTHDPVAGTTTLDLAGGAAVAGSFAAPGSAVTLEVPVVVLSPPTPAAAASPALLLTPLEAREDPERTPGVPQRDSFRPRADGLVCSVRPSARAYTLDYQVDAVAPDRGQQVRLQQAVLERVSADLPLFANGAALPVAIVPPPALESRAPGERAPLYLRIGTRMETGPRREQRLVRRAEVNAAPPAAPTDVEGIVLVL